MSAPPKFATLPDAIAAYIAGRSRRWADVDGHQVDLHAAAHPCATRVDDGLSCAERLAESTMILIGRDDWDRRVALNIAAELSQAVEVLPDLAAPSEAARDVECCEKCGRPMIGEVGR